MGSFSNGGSRKKYNLKMKPNDISSLSELKSAWLRLDSSSLRPTKREERKVRKRGMKLW